MTQHVHLHALKLLALALAAEEGRRAVLHEAGLALGEARDVRGHKVLGRYALADRALLECARSRGSTAFADAEVVGVGVVVVLGEARGA